MSITGLLVYFVENKPADMTTAIRGLLKVAQVAAATGVSVARHPYHIVQVLQGRPEFDWRAIDRLCPTKSKWLGPVSSIDQLLDITKSNVRTHMNLLSPRARALGEGIKRDIPSEISDNAWVTDFSLTIGSHDWAEESPVGNPPECNYFGRSEVAVELSGYGSPADPAKYREMIFQIPEFIQLQRDIEGVLGPVKRCISWDF